MNDDTHLSTSDLKTLYIINYAFTTLSLVSGTFVIYAFVKTWKRWTYSGKMIIYLTSSNLLYSITNLLTLADPELPFVCDLDGFLRTFTTLSSFFWATKIALTAYRAISSQHYNPHDNAGAITGILLPCFASVLPLFKFDFLSYNYLGMNCDISSKTETWTLIWLFIILLGPMIIGTGLTLFFYLMIIKYLKEFQGVLGIPTSQFVAYPLGLIISWFPSIVFKVAYLFGYRALWLEAVSIAFSRSSGFINVLIYGWQSLIAYQNSKQKKNIEHPLESESWGPEQTKLLGHPNTIRKSKSLASF